MSLLGLQSAITNLIRLPRENRGDLASFVKDFDLTPQELKAVSSLAEHAELNKYGHELAGQRWDKIHKRILRLFTFVSHEWVESVWFERFEPQAKHLEGDIVGRDTYTLAFIDFLRTDPETVADLIEIGPAFVLDLLLYLRAEGTVRRYLNNETAPPKGSHLKHQAFKIVRLGFDIPDVIDRALAEEDTGLSQLEASQRDLTVLMLMDQAHEFRMFEIDNELAAFLEAEAERSTAGRGSIKDSVYTGLCELGLCHDRPALHAQPPPTCQ